MARPLPRLSCLICFLDFFPIDTTTGASTSDAGWLSRISPSFERSITACSVMASPSLGCQNNSRPETMGNNLARSELWHKRALPARLAVIGQRLADGQARSALRRDDARGQRNDDHEHQPE